MAGCVSLDGNFPPEFGVARTPRFAHAAHAERVEDLVTAELGAGFHVFACVEMGNLGKYYERRGLEAIKQSLVPEVSFWEVEKPRADVAANQLFSSC